MSGQVIHDAEFGEISVTKRRGTKNVRIKVGTNGRYQVSAPFYTPLFYIKQVIQSSREELRKLAKRTSVAHPYVDGQAIGRTHRLAVVPSGLSAIPSVKISRQTLLVYLPPGTELSAPNVQQLVRDQVVRILRREAKTILPERIASFAHEHGFRYERLRFSHAAGRWGSCSSTGTISLNIALMKLPDPLIDYVLVHELSHTRHMNHSSAFWQQVAVIDPHYKLHRQQLKVYTPAV